MNGSDREGAVLVNVSAAREADMAAEELEQLARTAGYEVRAYLTQRRARPDKSYFIGKGKLDELKSVVEATDSSVVIFENEVGGTQLNNLENALGVTVMDRSTLIIEIFARHATTNEGKLQVELMKKKKTAAESPGTGRSSFQTGRRRRGRRRRETRRRRAATGDRQTLYPLRNSRTRKETEKAGGGACRQTGKALEKRRQSRVAGRVHQRGKVLSDERIDERGSGRGGQAVRDAGSRCQAYAP